MSGEQETLNEQIARIKRENPLGADDQIRAFIANCSAEKAKQDLDARMMAARLGVTNLGFCEVFTIGVYHLMFPEQFPLMEEKPNGN